MISGSIPLGILDTVKKMLGLSKEYTVYDPDLVVLINSAIMVLKQIGVAKEDYPGITGADDQWEDLLENVNEYPDAKTYVYLKVRQTFDPPVSQTAMAAIKDQISESEWRLNVQSETEELKVPDPVDDLDD